ncbi:MAG: type VI secretion system tip protein VgrG [Chitinophagaceae bacterium]
MSNSSTVLAARNEATDVVNFKIKLNGQAINGEYGIVSLNVARTFNKIASARIIITDGDVALQDFAISSKDDALIPGSKIEISLGYHAEAKSIFKGIITKHALKSSKNKHSILIIDAKDSAIKLTLARNNHCFVDMTDKDILEKIIKQSGYKGNLEMDATPSQHKEMIQYNSMDWDFIVSRAEMNGMMVLTDDEKLIIKTPDTSQEAAKELTYGIDVMEFESEINGSSQLKKVVSHSWNSKDQKLEDSPDGNVSYKESGNLKADDLAGSMGVNEYHLYHSGNVNKDELKLWSNAKLLKSRMSKAAGKIKINGTTEIKPGQVIKLIGFSKRFNGNVFVTGVNQNYGESLWETDIQFGLPEQWYYQREDIIEKPASGLIPGIHGLQIGVVMQLESDPDNQHRVKIKLPLIDNADGIWARIASLDAGNERGSFFRPEIADEVVVGFLSDDPRHPVILGMLNSNAKPAPIDAKDTNHEKGFVTRSKMKFVFNDEKKTVTLETPKGKKIVVDEDADSIVLSDDHRNKISMTSDGIIIESGKDISLKASAGDIKMESINIEAKANAKFSAQANAQASVQSSGITEIKGSIVKIN